VRDRERHRQTETERDRERVRVRERNRKRVRQRETEKEGDRVKSSIRFIYCVNVKEKTDYILIIALSERDRYREC